ncbi:hypothetical protein O181_052763 [Austropuccinia psidii MF-1]|uniref:Uncharacterized protein n=1 Tax=Austropuccinia psidii MF-1 TaxID=1389203 RepID=A0A9Q3E394_9BASI|nr:hypothetical protein [Austropuccinia psidii MF-1]
MSLVHLRDLGFQRHKPEDREGLSRNRRPGREQLGHSDGWQDIEGNYTHSAIHIPIQQKPQTRGLEGYGPSSSAQPTPQRGFSMEHGHQEVQPGIPLGRTCSKFPEDLSQRDRLQRPYGNNQRLESHQEVQIPGGEGKQDKEESIHYPSYRRTNDPDREYSDSFRLTRSRPNQLSSGFTPFRNQQIRGQESPFFTIPGERVRPNYPEAVGFGERRTQEPEVVVHNSNISSPINRNIAPTQIEHNVVTPESNLNSYELWLQISQYAEQTQKQFSELEARHDRMKTLTASVDKIAKTLQEEHAQLRKASESTNNRLNLVFEEQHPSKRDMDCLDQDTNKEFNVYHNLKPQSQGHFMDNPYHQEYVKQYAMLVNRSRSPSQYQDGDNMSYSEKEALKQLPEASSCLKLSGTGEHDHIEFIYHIYGLFIDVASMQNYWITARFNTAFKGHASIGYTEMKEIHGRRNWVELKDKAKERVAELTKKKNSCQNCGSTDHYANNSPKAKKKVYAIEKVPEGESPTENSESDSMGDAIREQSDEKQDPNEEFPVEYQEEKPLEIQDIQLEAGMPQDTANKNLCKHTQDSQKLLVTPTKGIA